MPRIARLSRIDEHVNNLLRSNRVTKPPVRVDAIARNLGALIKYEPFDDGISGVFYRDNRNVVIGVNSLHHPNRQRFTIAHEIGHLVLHGLDVHVDKGYRMILRDSKSSQAVDPMEIDANRFAAALLMPADLVRHDVRKYIHDVEDDAELKQLAKRFQVSTQAMAFRLANLEVFA
jgi:Zn-dependent peptidase ImmA (M78 family)